jgi:uncharacterized protein YjbJ (UPF0337 family)
MNWDTIEGKWKDMKGRVRSQWAKLTDDDLKMLAGKKDQLVGKIQERYGVMRDEAERQVDDWLQKLDVRDKNAPPPPRRHA